MVVKHINQVVQLIELEILLIVELEILLIIDGFMIQVLMVHVGYIILQVLIHDDDLVEFDQVLHEKNEEFG
jgi:hypothetical protein